MSSGHLERFGRFWYLEGNIQFFDFKHLFIFAISSIYIHYYLLFHPSFPLIMASANPGLDLVSVPAEDPPKNPTVGEPAEESLSDHPIAPDQFDPRLETDKLEIWSYYLYYVGNNGLTLFNFAPTAFQNLLAQAAGDAEVLSFAGRYVALVMRVYYGGADVVGVGRGRLIRLCC